MDKNMGKDVALQNERDGFESNGDSFLPVSDPPLEWEIYGDFLLWFPNMVE